MSLRIGTIDFDIHDGAIITPKLRVLSYERSDIAQAGAQVLPTAGRTFPLNSTRYEPTTLAAENLKKALDAYIGTTQAIVSDGVIYATDYSVKFVVVDVQHLASQAMVRARGARGGLQTINYAPALAVVSNWILQATPV